MARLVHLVRHGEVDNPTNVVYASLPGFGLSEVGRAQAVRAARHLGNRPVVAVWSSPLERALATAAIIARRFGLPVSVDGRLTEWQLNDRWAGVGWDEIADEFPGELDAYLHDPLDLPFSSESLSNLAERMRTAVIEIAARYRNGDLVLIGHQDPLQAARLALTSRSPASQHHDKPGHGSVISFDPSDGWNELGVFDPVLDSEAAEEVAVGLEGEIG